MKISNRGYYWEHFDDRRTKRLNGDIGVLVDNLTNISMPRNSTHYDHLVEFGRSSHKPFPIKFIAEELKERHSIRGCVYFGATGDQIQQVVANYPELRWWMEKDALVVDKISPQLEELSDFDRFAGSLLIEHFKNNKLSKPSLEIIAAELDTKGFVLKENLQKAQWMLISSHNQKHSRVPIKHFSAAVKNPKFVRCIRRRLYLARDRYQKAL